VARRSLPGIVLLAAGLVAALPVIFSDESLTGRVVADEKTFNQEPRDMRLQAGGIAVELAGPPQEVAWLAGWLTQNGFPPRVPQETSRDFALRAARFVQQTLTFGPGGPNHFRGWGSQLVLEGASAGEHFYCDSYARLLADIVQTGGLAARSVWMTGHVTAEVYIPEDHQWMVVDPMLNFFATDNGRPLSVTGIRKHLLSGRSMRLHPISDAAAIDEPSRSRLGHHDHASFGGSEFTVYDSAISFNRGQGRIVTPAISLSTPGEREGSSFAIALLRVIAPALAVVGGLLIVAGRR
jgi:hypothetical protein